MLYLRKEKGLLLASAIVGIAFLAVCGFGIALADTYTYDELGRLHTVTYSDGSSITYGYDKAGNRLTVSQTAAP